MSLDPSLELGNRIVDLLENERIDVALPALIVVLVKLTAVTKYMTLEQLCDAMRAAGIGGGYFAGRN